MTSASARRAQSRQRGRRHRALRKRGKAAYCVRAHERRRAEALIKPAPDAPLMGSRSSHVKTQSRSEVCGCPDGRHLRTAHAAAR
jgi:hypothetical protein